MDGHFAPELSRLGSLPDGVQLGSLAQALASGSDPLEGRPAEGAGWAEEAWGTYWSWDPKERASLVTWCVYAAYIHASRSTRFARTPSRVLNILGFVSMMFTFLGFNLVAKLLGLPTAHAYT